MRPLFLLACVHAAGVLAASPASSQTTTELGVDAAWERVTAPDIPSGGAYTLLALPMQSVRVGFVIPGGFSVEPRLGITRISGEGSTDNTQVRASLAGLIYLGGMDEERPSFFVSVVTGLDYAHLGSGADDASAVQLRAGGGGGVLAPLREHLAFRGSVEYHRSFESRDALASDHLIVAFGLSFLLR